MTSFPFTNMTPHGWRSSRPPASRRAQARHSTPRNECFILPFTLAAVMRGRTWSLHLKKPDGKKRHRLAVSEKCAVNLAPPCDCREQNGCQQSKLNHSHHIPLSYVSDRSSEKRSCRNNKYQAAIILIVTFKSVYMGPPHLDRAGAISSVPSLSRQRRDLFYDLSARETCPLRRSPRMRSGPGLPPQISREKTAPSRQSLQKRPIPARRVARCKRSLLFKPM